MSPGRSSETQAEPEWPTGTISAWPSLGEDAVALRGAAEYEEARERAERLGVIVAKRRAVLPRLPLSRVRRSSSLR